MKRPSAIVIAIFGFVIFLVGISLLISSGYLSHVLCDRQQFAYNSLYEFVRDETAQGIQTAGKWCAIFGGATALVGLIFQKKKEEDTDAM